MEKPPHCLAQSNEMKPKWESLPLLPAFGSLQIDLIYYGPWNSGISYNFCHVSSLLLLKINSPKRKWFPRDNMKSVIVSFLLSVLSGELKRENISKTISTFFFNKKNIGISLPLAMHAFEGSRPFSWMSSKFLMLSVFFPSIVNTVNKCFENQNNHNCMMHLVFERYFILNSLS